MRPSFGIGVVLCAGTVVLAAVMAGAGCTVLTNDALPDDAGKFEGGGGDGGSAVCATCLADQCTGQLAACLTDPTCLEEHLCLSGRGSCTCSWTGADGGATSDDGGDAGAAVDAQALHAAFAACVGDRLRSGGACATDCSGQTKPPEKDPCAVDGGADSGSTDAGADASGADAGDDAGDAAIADAGDGGAGDAGTTPGGATVDGCTGCVSGKCGDAEKACAIGSECIAYLECAYGAADVAAADECGRQHATGETAAALLATCTRVGCSEACGF